MSRPTRTLAAAVAVVAALATTATACGDDGKADPTPTPTTSRTATSTSPTPTTTPSPTSTKTPDEVGAEQAVVAFAATIDKLESDPNTSLQDLVKVSRGESASVWRQLISNHRMRQYKQTGATRVEDARAQENAKGQWEAEACIDVTKVNLVDKDGKSVVNAGRPNRLKYEYGLEKDEGKFYVTKDEVAGRC